MAGHQKAGRLDIADIVRDYRADLEKVHSLSPEHKRVLTDIAQCRTAALGGHLGRCQDCGHEHPFYNSCRNRHCPKCQVLAQHNWMHQQKARMLDVKHFHVVFTLPEQLRPLAAFAPRILYEALLTTASRTLLEFGRSTLSAIIGATLVLHTWNRKLQLHPHVHAIVTGGGLSLDGPEWKPSQKKFLFPVKAMSPVFRGKMVDELKRLYCDGKFAGFDDFRDPQAFDRLIGKVCSLSWNVYAKRSFDKATHVVQYLGQYTHRVAISNSRLLRLHDDQLTFKTKGKGTETIDAVEFLRRFLKHVLPAGQHKIRHIGLYASAQKRQKARDLLKQPTIDPGKFDWRALLKQTTGRDPSRCARCGGRMTFEPLPPVRAPPTDSAVPTRTTQSAPAAA